MSRFIGKFTSKVYIFKILLDFYRECWRYDNFELIVPRPKANITFFLYLSILSTLSIYTNYLSRGVLVSTPLNISYNLKPSHKTSLIYSSSSTKKTNSFSVLKYFTRVKINSTLVSATYSSKLSLLEASQG